MGTITNTTQLSTFSIIRGILISNTILSTKFNTNDFYEFEPRHKSSSFKGLPYIVIMVPEVSDIKEGMTLGNISNEKQFDVTIILRMEYEARDNYSSYASNIISALDSSLSTFEANGYYFEDISLDSTSTVIMDQKHMVEGQFTLRLQGEIQV